MADSLELASTLLNLTPHPVVLETGLGTRVTLASMGALQLTSRAQFRYESLGIKGGGGDDYVPVITAQDFTGLDELSPGFALYASLLTKHGDGKTTKKARGIIVAMPVAQWLANHLCPVSVYSPSTSPANAVRDANGKIVAVRALEIHNPNWN